jgi:hypothetical protein
MIDWATKEKGVEGIIALTDKSNIASYTIGVRAKF